MTEPGIERVAVIGAGLMGFGVGVEFARFGYQVSLYNTREESSRNAMTLSREALDLMAETELITAGEADAAYGRLRPTTDMADAVDGVDFVHESVLEVMDLKKEVFARLGELCPPTVILATNTSGLGVSEIASVAKHPERVLATHYFQPPHFVPLVEVVGGEKTERRHIDTAVSLLRGMRKRVVQMDIEMPGFAGNRIQGVIGREIRALVDAGVCTPEMIDDIIQFGFGRRMAYSGYFKRLDLIGLDFIAMGARGRGVEPWGPVSARVDRGDLGMKSGKGFYDWSGGKAKDFHRYMNLELIRLMKLDMDAGEI